MDPTGRSERINSAGARHFGHQDILLEPKAGGSAIVRGVFRRSYVAVDPETGAQVQSTYPLLIVEDNQLPGGSAAAEGDQFTVAGVRYVVRLAEPEGEGTTRYYLRLP